MQAAVGLGQLTKLPEFIQIRKKNFLCVPWAMKYYKFFSEHSIHLYITYIEVEH